MIDKPVTEERPAPPPIVVTHQAGVRFAAQVGRHELILDQTLRGGGRDAGPSPLDLLGAGLGGCVALYVHNFLVAREVSAEGLRVEVTQFSVRAPHRIGRFEVRIILPPDVPALYRAMVEAVARVCPAYNTLASGTEVAIILESAGALVESGA